MKFAILLITGFIFSGCSSRPSIEQLAKRYMSDSIVSKMDDPSSYQFVSMDKPDSVSNHAVILKEQMQYLTDLQSESKELEANNLKRINESIDNTGTKLDKDISQGRKKIDSLINIRIASLKEKDENCRKQLLIPDSLNHLILGVNFRGKNKMGALILDHMNLDYYPAENRFVPKLQ